VAVLTERYEHLELARTVR